MINSIVEQSILHKAIDNDSVKFDVVDLRLSMRYEDYSNYSSFDPKLSLKYQPNEKISPDTSIPGTKGVSGLC